ncbi:unnamed protein product [Mycena citricolor]|uniref:Uncharacterized protein n=1 Tax=Mycena citricolor TaxID=2018698 RepID=A0AAD2H9H5_9AGAR|nr:unnamed protein product [Mycena citricolor]
MPVNQSCRSRTAISCCQAQRQVKLLRLGQTQITREVAESDTRHRLCLLRLKKTVSSLHCAHVSSIPWTTDPASGPSALKFPPSKILLDITSQGFHRRPNSSGRSFGVKAPAHYELHHPGATTKQVHSADEDRGPVYLTLTGIRR